MELLCVIAIIAILAALILPTLTQSKDRVKRIACENNLHQLGIAFHAFMHEHGDQFPMAVSQAWAGRRNLSRAAMPWAGNFTFPSASSCHLPTRLGSPVILICPADTRLPATNFTALQNSNVSYFVGVKATF